MVSKPFEVLADSTHPIAGLLEGWLDPRAAIAERNASDATCVTCFSAAVYRRPC